MANNSNLSKRAALRKQQELEEQRKRNKKMMTIGLAVVGVVAVVIVGVLAVALLNKNQQSQVTPPNATDAGGITINSISSQPQGQVPHVVVYEDYQCPACGQYEQAFGSAFLQLVDEGKITLEVRTAHFLDQVNKADNRKSSTRAALAAAAADQVGKYREYHAVLFAKQPTEGVGFTDEQLTGEFATEAGITGDDLATFKKLYEDKTYEGFVDKSHKAMSDNQVTGTPTYHVDGKAVEFFDPNTKQAVVSANDPDSLMAAIQAAADKNS